MVLTAQETQSSQYLEEQHTKQIVEHISDTQWREVKSQTQEIAGEYSFQFISNDGKAPIHTSGKLYLLYRTNLTLKMKDNKIDNNYVAEHEEEYDVEKYSVFNTKDAKQLDVNKFDDFISEIDYQEVSHKAETYIQKIKGENQFIVFRIILPKFNDIRKVTDQIRKYKYRDGNDSPILLALMAYFLFLNFMQLAPSIGIIISFFDTIPFTLNAIFITSIIWYGYTEYIQYIQWCTLKIVHKSDLPIEFRVLETKGNRDHTINEVRQYVTINHVEIFFSITAIVEALSSDDKSINNKLVQALDKELFDAYFDNFKTNKEVKRLKAKIENLMISLDESTRRGQEIARESLIQGWKLKNKPKFPEKIEQALKDENIWQYLLMTFAFVLMLGIFGFWVAPALDDLWISMLGTDIPELSIFSKAIIAGLIFMGIFFTMWMFIDRVRASR